MEDDPGVRSAELSSLSTSPAVVIDGDLEQAKVQETVRAMYEAAEAQNLDSGWVYTRYRGVEIALDNVADTGWIEAGAVLAHQPGVSSGEATPYKVEETFDGSVSPALTGVLAWAKEHNELDPKMLIEMHSDTAFSVETAVGKASSDLAALAKIPRPRTRRIHLIWSASGKTTLPPSTSTPRTCRRPMRPWPPTPRSRRRSPPRSRWATSTLRIRHQDTSRLRAFIDDMTRIDATVVDLGTSTHPATVRLPVSRPGIRCL